MSIFNYDKQNHRTIMKTNSSNYISSEVGSQLSENRLLYYIIFFSKIEILSNTIMRFIIKNY